MPGIRDPQPFADPNRPSLFDLIEDDPPVHRDDPHSSRQAAAKARKSAPTQSRLALEVIVAAGPDGVTTREIQRRLWETPAHPAWNKVPTRCLSLQRAGLVRREEGTRTTGHPDDGDQTFLVYVSTSEGRREVSGE